MNVVQTVHAVHLKQLIENSNDMFAAILSGKMILRSVYSSIHVQTRIYTFFFIYSYFTGACVLVKRPSDALIST